MSRKNKNKNTADMSTAPVARLRAKKGDNLHLAKKSGLKRIKRRKVSVTEEGIKPTTAVCLPYVHKHRLIKAAVVICVVAIIFVAVFGFGFFVKNNSVLDDQGFATVRATPDAGATPEQFMDGSNESALKNIAYMNDKISGSDFWESYYHGEVTAAMNIKQDVQTWKQYNKKSKKQGILISADITTSSLINNARQFCVIDDLDLSDGNSGLVMWRNAKDYKNSKTYKGMSTPWATKLENILNIDSKDPKKSYKAQRGLPHTAFSVYVINENTLLEATPVEKTEEGYYRQTYKLNPTTDPSESEKSAAYYYKQQMKATGDLSDVPTFESITVTYEFNDEWQVMRSEIEESYTAKMGVESHCSTVSYTLYNYNKNKKIVDDDGKQQNCNCDDYNKFFKGALEKAIAKAKSK